MELDYIIQQVLVTNFAAILIEIPIEYEEQIRG